MGVICDKKVPVTLIVKIYQTVVQSKECWATRKKEEHISYTTDMRMLCLIHGISLKDHNN